MKDYAERGFKVGTCKALLVGTDIALMLPGCMPVRAKVMWSLGGMAGCRFEEPINEHLMRAALAKLPDAGAADGLPFLGHFPKKWAPVFGRVVLQINVQA